MLDSTVHLCNLRLLRGLQPVYFEKETSFKDQITVMRFTDVLVGLHGSGLNNAMFMEPGSVVVAVMPANYIEYVAALWRACALLVWLIRERPSGTSGITSSQVRA